MSFPALKIGDLVARTPIVQGGMGVGISLSKLASAVANEGGIGGFLSGIVDTISGLFGGGTGDAGTGSGSSDEFGGSQATGDTALISVVAVAAVAGAALLLTKKKKEDK